MAQRMSVKTWDAMRDVLSTRTWFKNSFQRDMEALLRTQPQILFRIAWSANSKRESADTIIERLKKREDAHSDFLIDLVLELADTRPEDLTDYDNLARRDSKDAVERRVVAEKAIVRLRGLAEPYRERALQRERFNGE